MSLVRSLTDLLATPYSTEMFRCREPKKLCCELARCFDVRMDQGAACDRRHRVDGGHAVSAAAVCVSLRCRNRLEAIGNLQGDGASPTEGDHRSGHGGDVAGRAVSRLRRSLVLGPLAAWKIAAGDRDVGTARIFRPLR